MDRDEFEQMLCLLEKFREALGADEVLVGCEARDTDIVLLQVDDDGDERLEIDDVWRLIADDEEG